ncbi:DUF6325 family protein [Nocardia camponoti]|uniref:DUF1269 domain-containing protein n=1 Tax=Nocardia camponoti TaxID=1616106 RepID=A0A917Q852_9NOCA|nr:DUF6325 family protein [Nocardia camponoti]GGK34708.1 hypothetical protein GCM10011591_02910 [Nocardia camponoti]
MSPLPELGPVEFVALSFPGTRVDAAVVTALTEVIARGDVTILDLVVVVRDAAGELTEFELDDDLDKLGLSPVSAASIDLVSDDDITVVRDSLAPNTTAVVLVFEETWARRLANAVRDSGGEVMLHVQVPRESVEAALAASV